MKKVFKQKKGITLIALVITIIVLLILAGVSISMLSGDNSILGRATDAKEITGIEQIKERINTAYLGGLATGKGTITEDELKAELIKEFGASKVNDDTIDTSVAGKWTVTIDDARLSLPAGAASEPTVLTIGSEYEKGNIKIGDKLTYSANGQTNWIVFGKDESGNVLLTTEAPVGTYSPTYNAQHWFSWEDDLDAECDDYGTTLQGKTIQARSIRIEDINRVVGFIEPTSTFNRYQFVADGNTGTREDGVIKLNYYYPSLDAVSNTPAYFKKSGVGSATDSEVFTNNAYVYYWDSSASKWEYGLYGNGTNGYVNEHYLNDTGATEVADYNKFNTNIKLVTGETGSRMNPYFVASRSVYVHSSDACFNIAAVNGGCVFRNLSGMCGSNSSGGGSGGGPSGWGLRPIVILPSDIQVEEVTTGEFDIKS